MQFFSFLISSNFILFTNGCPICPGLCRHRTRAFIRKKDKVARNEKRKNYAGFLILKIQQILKRFGGTKTLAKTSYFWGVEMDQILLFTTECRSLVHDAVNRDRWCLQSQTSVIHFTRKTIKKIEPSEKVVDPNYARLFLPHFCW